VPKCQRNIRTGTECSISCTDICKIIIEEEGELRDANCGDVRAISQVTNATRAIHGRKRSEKIRDMKQRTDAHEQQGSRSERRKPYEIKYLGRITSDDDDDLLA
jgi:hypothetical protein